MKVSEFAKALNVSDSFAYELLRQEQYSRYVSTVNGIKDVSTELLDILNGQEPPQIAEPQKQEEIEQLKAQIEELQQEVKEKDRLIAEYASKFAELAQQAQVLAGQAQVLQAANTKELPPPQEKKGLWAKIWGK